jgi:2-polyprenyl-3-methyl-5-hydroxy-6-metoxy-1,4-benzoquinol methylase
MSMQKPFAKLLQSFFGRRSASPRQEAAPNLHEIASAWWYYTIELLPALMAKGVYPPDLPMLPRLMVRQCQKEGMECLDLGTMEGLIPTLMCRGGAKRVVAADYNDHCAAKLAAVQFAHGVTFKIEHVGLVYDLQKKLPSEGFDLINLSGILYHVYSPLIVLAGARPLLKRNGLMIVSTNVINSPGCFMEFNDAGRMQGEQNTFWYMSVSMLDYALRLNKLAPIDCAFLPSESIKMPTRRTLDRPSGFVSVVCRAMDDVVPANGDNWMAGVAANSWEHRDLTDWPRAAAQPISTIQYHGNTEKKFFRSDALSLDLLAAVNGQEPKTRTTIRSDTHTLFLEDRS